MAQAHSQGEAGNDYFLDQLFMILSCGGLGIVAILMYQTGTLGRILVPMFFVPVLLGGIVVLAMVSVRAINVWKLASANARCPNQGDQCGHTHSHGHAHSGKEQHEHGWAPWRYMVLAIPVFLYFLGLPREGLGEAEIDKIKPGSSLQASPERQSLSMVAGGSALTTCLRKKQPRRLQLRFRELAEAAAIKSRRDEFDGDVGIIRGMYLPLRSDREFSLLREYVTCCRADAVFLQARIEIAEPVQGIEAKQWVQVKGSFRSGAMKLESGSPCSPSQIT